MCLCVFLHLNEGIPTLVILDSDCNLITTGGRGAVMADADGNVSTLEIPLVAPVNLFY